NIDYIVFYNDLSILNDARTAELYLIEGATKPEGANRMNRSAHSGPVASVGSYATFISGRRFASLDGLRAMAIAGVLWYHTTNDLPFWPALRRGFLGVDFFFILSGFLIVTLLLRER